MLHGQQNIKKSRLVGCYETSVCTDQTTRCHRPEELNLNTKSSDRELIEDFCFTSGKVKVLIIMKLQKPIEGWRYISTHSEPWLQV